MSVESTSATSALQFAPTFARGSWPRMNMRMSNIKVAFLKWYGCEERDPDKNQPPLFFFQCQNMFCVPFYLEKARIKSLFCLASGSPLIHYNKKNLVESSQMVSDMLFMFPVACLIKVLSRLFCRWSQEPRSSFRSKSTKGSLYILHHKPGPGGSVSHQGVWQKHHVSTITEISCVYVELQMQTLSYCHYVQNEKGGHGLV